jgi:hypothetical protein
LEGEGEFHPIFLSIVSNLLRDYSLQEPSDLRIRRRKSPLPVTSLIQSFENAANLFIRNLEDYQVSFGKRFSSNFAYNIDFQEYDDNEQLKGSDFDFCITSPPYATALPYIDTQRLSLIWLGLIEPASIKHTEAILIGSREFNSKRELNEWYLALMENSFELDIEVFTFCRRLQDQLHENDGFRRKALPSLLYRYFVEMKSCFLNVQKYLKSNSFFALIVGHNHTNIGGKRTDIDTPRLLSIIGESIGFDIVELISLDVYQRYGIHSSNAVQKESLVIFKKVSDAVHDSSKHL